MAINSKESKKEDFVLNLQKYFEEIETKKSLALSDENNDESPSNEGREINNSQERNFSGEYLSFTNGDTSIELGSKIYDIKTLKQIMFEIIEQTKGEIASKDKRKDLHYCG